MSCKVERDKNGTTYIVPAAKAVKDAGGRMVPGVPELQVWWSRRFKAKRDELLLIRQENSNTKADVVAVTLGQLYDLIDAANQALEGA